MDIDHFPLVSVIIPAYNHEKYIGLSLQSILEQNYANIELIVINDGSSDTTGAIASEFCSVHADAFKRVLFIDKPNEGVTKTLNHGVTVANGDYVFLIASDDYLVDADAIKTLALKMLGNPSTGMVCGDAKYIDQDGNPPDRSILKPGLDTFIKRHFPTVLGLDIENDFGSYKSFLHGNYVTGGFLIRKSVYADIGLYDPDSILEDYGFWLRLAKTWRLEYCPEVFMHYRVHASNTISTRKRAIMLEVADLLLAEKQYAMKNGYSRHWRKGAYTAGLQLLKSPSRNGFSRMLRLLFSSIPNWHLELSAFVMRQHKRWFNKR